jgi:hypothetical protein
LFPLIGEALPRQDDALADRCAVAVILARAREANFPRKESKNFTQYSYERPEMTTQQREVKEGQNNKTQINQRNKR